MSGSTESTPTASYAVYDWRDKAACLKHDPELFFPVPEMTKKRPSDMARKAIAVCDGCDVSLHCLEYALDSNQPDGIWGGLTTDQRKEILRRIRQQRRRNLIESQET